MAMGEILTISLGNKRKILIFNWNIKILDFISWKLIWCKIFCLTTEKHYNSLFISMGPTQHLTVTLTVKNHWPHDLHDLVEKRFVYYLLQREFDTSHSGGHAAIILPFKLHLSSFSFLVGNLPWCYQQIITW